ncbi:MAG: HDIG domain-containing protein [Clostridia bacterium]|nr:HDIG domain-containing protein [Clostridia bacterium]
MKENPLTPKQLYTELTKHLCSDLQPSEYLNRLLSEGSFDEHPFSMLKILDTIPQSPIYHPEGCVWNHVCLVVDQAAQLRRQSCTPVHFMWAALLHDIGKSKTTRTRKGRITAYDHDTVGMQMAVEFLSPLTEDEEQIRQVSKLVKYHMHPLYVLKGLPFADISGMKSETDVREIALLGFCDRMGRIGSQAEDEKMNIEEFMLKCGIEDGSLHLSSTAPPLLSSLL